MTTNQDAQTLEETLNKTDLGHVINENKKPILIAAAVIVIAIIAYSISNSMKDKERLEVLDKVFDVEKEVFKGFLIGKNDTKKFLEDIKTVDAKLVAHPNLVPSFIEVMNKISEKDQVDAEVVAVAEKWNNTINKSNNLSLFMAVNLSGLYEDNNEIDKAIKVLEAVVGNKSTVLKDKIHFDLGRFYVKQGNLEKAKMRFDFILKDEKKKNSEYARLAKIYLNGI